MVRLQRKGRVVVGVHADSQASGGGVAIGWIFDSIDGEPFTDDLLRTKKLGSINYKVKFIWTQDATTLKELGLLNEVDDGENHSPNTTFAGLEASTSSSK